MRRSPPLLTGRFGRLGGLSVCSTVTYCGIPEFHEGNSVEFSEGCGITTASSMGRRKYYVKSLFLG